MKKEYWERVKTAFDQANELDGSARKKFLNSLKARDREVYQDVESLLKASRKNVRFLDDPARMD